MATYHVGCGIARIYAGTLNKKGNMWVNKSDVTDEAFRAVAQYCVENHQSMKFEMDGKKYRLAVMEVEE